MADDHAMGSDWDEAWLWACWSSYVEALAGWPAAVNADADAEDDDDRGGGGSFLDMMVWFGSYLGTVCAESCSSQAGSEGNFRTRQC